MATPDDRRVWQVGLAVKTAPPVAGRREADSRLDSLRLSCHIFNSIRGSSWSIGHGTNEVHEEGSGPCSPS